MPDELDDLIGERLRSSIPKNNNALDALATSQPAMKQARRRRQIQTSLASVTIVAGLVGVSLVTLNGQNNDGRTIIADAPEQTTTSASPFSQTTSGPPEATPQNPTSPLPETTLRPIVTSNPDATTTETTSNPGTTETTAATPTITELPNTTQRNTLSQGSTTIDSDCGSITVEVADDTVALVDVDPRTGFTAEIDNESSEKVAVEFEGEPGHCDVKIEWEDGSFVSSVSSESASD